MLFRSTNASPDTDTAATTNAAASTNTDTAAKRKPNEPPKPIEVVFLVENDRAKMAPVERGISDDSYTEIVKGLEEGQEVVSGGYKAISRDLEDGKRIRRSKETAADSDGKPETQP